jgi:hypothetical protein
VFLDYFNKLILKIIFLGVINILRSIEEKVEEFFSIDVLWPPKILAEYLLMRQLQNFCFVVLAVDSNMQEVEDQLGF